MIFYTLSSYYNAAAVACVAGVERDDLRRWEREKWPEKVGRREKLGRKCRGGGRK